MARGRVNLDPVVRFTRNMLIVRHQGRSPSSPAPVAATAPLAPDP